MVGIAGIDVVSKQVCVQLWCVTGSKMLNSQTKIVSICVTTMGAVTYPSGTEWSQGDCDCFNIESNKYSFEIMMRGLLLFENVIN